MKLKIKDDSLIFDIQFNVFDLLDPRLFNGTHDKELSKYEDINYVDKDKFSIRKNATTSDIKALKEVLNSIFLTQVKNELISCLDEFGSMYRLEKAYQSGNVSKQRNLGFSYSFYYHIKADINEKNISAELNKVLSSFIIRFSTHMNQQQLNGLKDFKSNKTKSFSYKIPDLTKDQIHTFVTSILDVHSDLITYIRNNKNKYYTVFEDIGEKYITLLKNLSVQGDFN